MEKILERLQTALSKTEDENIKKFVLNVFPELEENLFYPGTIFYRGTDSTVPTFEISSENLQNCFILVHGRERFSYILRNMHSGQAITNYEKELIFTRQSFDKSVTIPRFFIHSRQLTKIIDGKK